MNLETLNENQLKAVNHKEGPCLVIAGAGSGKTRVLTTRIAYLIQSGIPSYKILAITFTNKAAREMRERLEVLVPDHKAFVGTFHSLGIRIIRENYSTLGLDNNFTILDSDDVTSIIRKLLKDKYCLVKLMENDQEIIKVLQLGIRNGRAVYRLIPVPEKKETSDK